MKQFRRSNLPAAVADHLRQQIQNGTYQPGDRLPGNRELTALFGVSMGSVREAIGMLVSEGLIEARAGRGTFVAQAGGLPMTRTPGRALERREVEQLIEAREVLELPMVMMAAQRASRAHVAKLWAAVARMEDGVNDPTVYSNADIAFHIALAEATQNRFLIDAISMVRGLLERDMELSAEVGLRRHGDLRFSIDSHRRVVEAIEAGDPERAQEELFEIMGRHHEFVLGLYGANPAAGGGTLPEAAAPGAHEAAAS